MDLAGIGAPLRRVEDERLLRGRGQFADDVAIPGLARAAFVRSPHAHARLGRIDASRALACPGVLAVLTDADVRADGLRDFACHAYPPPSAGRAQHRPLQPLLARGKVRHVGEAIALVIAETLQQARDAAEQVDIHYEALPAVLLEDALAPGAARVWDDARDNIAFTLERGDAAAVARAFASAAHVTRLTMRYPRASANTLEPRTVLACPDPLGRRWTLCTSTQSPFHVRQIVAEALGIDESALRVVANDVGGGFGMKAHVYPEEALLLWASRRLERPVKWTGERGEGLASDVHGRHQHTEAALALDATGRALALRLETSVDLGAYLSHSAGVPPNNAAVSFPGAYDIALVHAKVQALFSNTSPMGPYRGSGKPEASLVMDRLLDAAAREMGLDPVAVKRANLVAPSAMPYRTSAGHIYDCGDFPAVLDRAVTLADIAGFAARRRASEQRGRLRGLGLAMHCQRAGNQSERMEIRVAQNGSVAVHAGTLSTGQGHETMFAQMVSEWLGLPTHRVRVFQGDTDHSLFGRGTFAQRTMNAGGSALRAAAMQVIERGKRLAAFMLEAAEDDIEFAKGVFTVKGTDRRADFAQVAAKSYQGMGLPPALGVGLDGVGSHPGPNTYPNGCMIAEVEIDPETGEARVERLCAVDDAGTVINPVTLEGQLHGSVAQGLGEMLLEQVVYEPASGQLLSGSFMDYAMPRADDLPGWLHAEARPVPTATNPLGVKGGAEAGNVGAPPAIMNALLDALLPLGVGEVPMPATPGRLWQAIRAARAA